MADIKNYTLNFGSGRPRWRADLTCALRRSASTEIELHRRAAGTTAIKGR